MEPAAWMDTESDPAKVNLVGAASEATCGQPVDGSIAQHAALTLDRLDPARVDWDELDAYHDRNVFQTREWLAFVEETQHAEPVIAAVRQNDGEQIGIFTGLIVRRYGVRILGSPFRGWTTGYLGFNLPEGVSRRAAVEALVPFAFGSLQCRHIELRDRYLPVDDVQGLGFDWSPKTIFEVDLRAPEDELFARMTSACRRCIRKAQKVGVVIEEANDREFTDDYYAQLEDVFAKQGLLPTYDRGRVDALLRHLLPTGRLLLLRARDSEARCIATGIFPAMNGRMYFWGGASWREHQILRPNELLMWYAMRYWKTRGIDWCDLGGGAEYKRKYGPAEIAVPYFRISRGVAISRARDLAKRAFKMRLWAKGRLARLSSRAS